MIKIKQKDVAKYCGVHRETVANREKKLGKINDIESLLIILGSLSKK